MHNQPKPSDKHSTELQEARRQEAMASNKRLYALAEKITGMTTAERVASALRKSDTPSCTTK